jgi:hypothetical protein
MRTPLIQAIFLFAYSPLFAAVSSEEMLNYLEDKSTKTEISSFKQIYISNNETAYIASSEFPEQGRNFVNGYIVYSPTLKKAIKLNRYGGQSNAILDVYGYGKSPLLIVLDGSGSGQGSYGYTQTAISVNGWLPTELAMAESGHNNGNSGLKDQLAAYYSKEVFLNHENNLSDDKTHVFALTTVNTLENKAQPLKPKGLR